MRNRIESYKFGRMVINGKKYNSDILVFQDKIIEWWRKEGHVVNIEDIEKILEVKPEILVIGTGYYGLLKVPNEIVNILNSYGIKVIIEKTEKAYQIFNELSKSRNVIGAFHLTC